MISLIKFDRNYMMPLEEAKELGVVYETIDGKTVRVGMRGGSIESMSNSDCYIDELEKITDEDGKTKYMLNGKVKESYYIYERVDYEGHVWVKNDGNHMIDLFKFAPICRHKYSIIKTVKPTEPSIGSITNILDTVESKVTSLSKAIEGVSSNTFNSKTNVHIGGGLLASYNDLMLKENTCTDVLQTELNNGWRIIAVCVQPDQRRPDYILGRYNPKMDVESNGGAKR